MTSVVVPESVFCPPPQGVAYYLAHPYSGEEIESYLKALYWLSELLPRAKAERFCVYSPIAVSHPLAPVLPPQGWVEYDLLYIETVRPRMLFEVGENGDRPAWKRSEGCRREFGTATSLGLECYQLEPFVVHNDLIDLVEPDL